MNDPKLIAIYGRCSTDLQEQSIEAQHKRLVQWAEFNEYVVDPGAIFLEPDVSGTIPFADRDKGGALLRLVREGRHRYVVVAKIDRLGRNALDVLNTLEMFKQMNVRVFILDVGGNTFDSQSTLSGMIIAVLAYAAQMDVERIQENTRRVLESKFAKWELTGTVPYGANAVETGAVTTKGVKIRQLVPNEYEIGWLRQMMEWRKLGLAYNKIAKRLNEFGVPTKRAGQLVNKKNPHVAGSTWQAGNVKRVLESKHTARFLAGATPPTSQRAAA